MIRMITADVDKALLKWRIRLAATLLTSGVGCSSTYLGSVQEKVLHFIFEAAQV